MKLVKGLTLLEVVITVLIISSVYVLSFNIHPSLKKHQLAVLLQEWDLAIAFARLQAGATGSQLILSPGKSTTDWARGFTLFTARDNSAIYQWHFKPNQLHIFWDGFQSKQELIFSPTLQHRALSGTFRVYMQEKLLGKLVINRLGKTNLLPIV